MKGYKRIRPGMAEKGDMVKVICREYNPDIGSGMYTKNFVNVVRFMRLLDMPTNNGNVKACGFTGKGFKWLNLDADSNIIGIYRKE